MNTKHLPATIESVIKGPAAGQADRQALERAENEGLAEPLEQDRNRQNRSRSAPCSGDEHRSES